MLRNIHEDKMSCSTNLPIFSAAELPGYNFTSLHRLQSGAQFGDEPAGLHWLHLTLLLGNPGDGDLLLLMTFLLLRLLVTTAGSTQGPRDSATLCDPQ